MPIRPITLEESTPDQRRDYARNFLQIDVADDSDDAVLSKLAAAQPGVTNIFVNEPDTPEDVAAAETAGEVPLAPEEANGKSVGTLGQGDPRATIFIPVIDSEDGSGSRDVTVGVNGRAWQLKRGFDLDVPWRVVLALQNAEQNIIRHDDREGHEGEVISRMANRFNISFIHRPTQAEIDAWHERVGAEFCA